MDSQHRNPIEPGAAMLRRTVTPSRQLRTLVGARHPCLAGRHVGMLDAEPVAVGVLCEKRHFIVELQPGNLGIGNARSRSHPDSVLDHNEHACFRSRHGRGCRFGGLCIRTRRHRGGLFALGTSLGADPDNFLGGGRLDIERIRSSGRRWRFHRRLGTGRQPKHGSRKQQG